MKRELLRVSILIGLLLTPLMLQAQWNATLTVTGESGTAPNVFTVHFGKDVTQNFIPAPPAPPQYLTYAQLYEPGWLSGPYLEMFYSLISADSSIWLLELDPNGNVMPPTPRTTTISWTPDSLPSTGECFLQDYFTGQIIVADLRSQSSLTVTSAEDLYYNIVWVSDASPVLEGRLHSPTGLALAQNYPNPFNPSTTITYSLPQATHVNLSVFQINGQRIKRLVTGWQTAGTHRINFEATDLAAGLYLYYLETDRDRVSGKMMLVK